MGPPYLKMERRCIETEATLATLEGAVRQSAAAQGACGRGVPLRTSGARVSSKQWTSRRKSREAESDCRVDQVEMQMRCRS